MGLILGGLLFAEVHKAISLEIVADHFVVCSPLSVRLRTRYRIAPHL
jgi:hypothetical protein